MKITLSTRTSQQLALTPQLQQAIRLLALSNLELRQELQNFIEENPLLELEDYEDDAEISAEPLQAEPETSPERDWEEDLPEPAREERLESSELQREEFSAEQAVEVDGPPEWEDPDSLADWKVSGLGAEDDAPESQDAIDENLGDHLRSQALGLTLSARDRAWLEILINALDEDGYLRDPLEEIAEPFQSLFEQHFEEPLDEDEMRLGLRLLQSFDPVGVGATSLQECLLLQLQRPQSQNCDRDVLEAAKRLVEFHLESLGQQPVASLAKSCGLDRGLIQDALLLIRQLRPKPASLFDRKEVATVIPDVTVQKDRSGRWVARLSTQALPKLQINPLYARLIRDHSGDSSLAQKLQEARWMVKNIEQRSDTILRVSQAIVAAQQPFFHLGPKAMKPMILKDIAESCELHESTVSRVTTQKFMLTPLGCFELKFFFSSHVGTDDGGAASATALKAQIGEWIRQESSAKPLSDQAIADRFAESGIVVARRTVAKYRESLRIPSASLRKQT
jgi:RNA polymerase sigma-54 factor